MCFGSVIMSYWLITPMYTKWCEQPTFTTVNSTHYPIWNIDFPAVTICSNNKVISDQLEDTLKKSSYVIRVGKCAKHKFSFI